MGVRLNGVGASSSLDSNLSRLHRNDLLQVKRSTLVSFSVNHSPASQPITQFFDAASLAPDSNHCLSDMSLGRWRRHRHRVECVTLIGSIRSNQVCQGVTWSATVFHHPLVRVVAIACIFPFCYTHREANWSWKLNEFYDSLKVCSSELFQVKSCRAHEF